MFGTVIRTLVALHAWHIGAPPPGYVAEGLTVVSQEAAEATFVAGHVFERRLEDVADFLNAAHTSGIAFVASIELHVVDRNPLGVWEECVTLVTPEEHTDDASKTIVRPVTRTVVEQKYECEAVMKPHSHMESSMEWSGFGKNRRMRSVSRWHTEMRSEQECGFRPVPRAVTQNEAQIEHHYTTAWILVPSTPVCTARERGAPTFVRAMAYD
jgi:hypothetical protein